MHTYICVLMYMYHKQHTTSNKEKPKRWKDFHMGTHKIENTEYISLGEIYT